MFSQNLIEERDFSISEPTLIGDIQDNEPDVDVTTRGDVWVTWSERSHEGDLIWAKNLLEDVDFKISSRKGVEFQPTILAKGSKEIFVAWVAYRGQRWHLLCRAILGGEIGDEKIIYTHSEGLFRPRLALDHDHHLWVVCERVSGNRTEILSSVRKNGRWRDKELTPLSSTVSCYRPDISEGPDDGLWISYDVYNGNNYEVFIHRLDQKAKPIQVTDNGFQNLHSSIAADAEDNLWIAWSSNQNKAYRDRWWLTKWPHLRRFDGVSFHEPCSPSPDVDIYSRDPFQGWEFPEVIVDQEQRIWLFGQASHTQYAQYYSGKKWSPLYTIAQRKWGSWKPRFRAARSGESIYVVSFGLSGAKIQEVVTRAGRTDPVVKEPDVSVTSRFASPESPPKEKIKNNQGEFLNIYFGDLHAHSVYGDGVGDIDEIYHRYRDAYGYHFACITEHDFLDGIELSDSEYAMIQNYGERLYQPGEFVTFAAYEWTSPAIAEHTLPGQKVGEGHKNVYYSGPEGPIFRYGEEKSSSGAKLLNRLKGNKALVIPHHTGWSGIRWEDHDENLQRLIEVCSIHGRFEFPGNKPIGYRRDHVHLGEFVMDGLNRGYKLGFVGGSDSHGTKWHHTELEDRDSHVPAGTQVGWKRDAYRGGMTAIIASRLSREDLFDALYNRQCYATSGEPIILDFRVNDRMMGSEISTTSPPEIQVMVRGTAPLRAVEIIKSGQQLTGVKMDPGEGVEKLTFSIRDPMIIQGESHYYYLRVTQEDGNMAWSSPIWVTHA